MMEKHPIKNLLLRVARAADSRRIGKQESRNGLGTGVLQKITGKT